METLEGLIAAQYQRDVTAHRVPPAYVIQQSRILEGVTRRYLAAIRELARVRKLQAGTPPVQVNTQVNYPARIAYNELDSAFERPPLRTSGRWAW